MGIYQRKGLVEAEPIRFGYRISANTKTIKNRKYVTTKKQLCLPQRDFLSGFSEGDEPCDYELECQRMVIRGVLYLDEHVNYFKQ